MLDLKKSTALAAAGLVALVVFGLFIWPTCYRYDHLKLGTSDRPVRTNRLTNTTEILFLDGWHNAKGRDSTPEKPLPAKELAKLAGDFSADSPTDWLNIDVYNGSNWVVSEITVLVELSGSKGENLSRSYRLLPKNGDLEPLSSETFGANLGATPKNDPWLGFKITSAKGMTK